MAYEKTKHLDKPSHQHSLIRSCTEDTQACNDCTIAQTGLSIAVHSYARQVGSYKIYSFHDFIFKLLGVGIY